MEKTTPLYATHQAHGGKIVPFAGYLLPVQYQTGVIAEHMAVREACGLFDVSHMGEILCEGPGALKLLNHLLTNDFTNMYDGQARYSLMCYENGCCVDDLIVYKVRDEHYFIVVNAANKDKDFAWMKAHEILSKLLPEDEFTKALHWSIVDTFSNSRHALCYSSIYKFCMKCPGQMRDLHQTYRQFAVGFLFHPDIDLQYISYPQQILFF